jgi:ferredoxin
MLAHGAGGGRRRGPICEAAVAACFEIRSPEPELPVRDRLMMPFDYDQPGRAHLLLNVSAVVVPEYSRARLPSMNCGQCGQICVSVCAISAGSGKVSKSPRPRVHTDHCVECARTPDRSRETLGRSLTFPARTAPAVRRSLGVSWPATETRARMARWES